jgi:hypothetical protein
MEWLDNVETLTGDFDGEETLLVTNFEADEDRPLLLKRLDKRYLRRTEPSKETVQYVAKVLQKCLTQT